jgi:L-threonylcarbamoyladenylate synthase
MSDVFRLSMARRALRGGGVVAYPTEAVWGLGCDPANRHALLKILDLKGRDAGKGLILVAADMQQLAALLDPLSTEQRELLASTWPGPTTWLIPHHHLVHPLVHGRFASVSVRVSRHPGVAALCRAFGGPVVSTSANPQGREPARDALTVRRYFNAGIDYLLAGAVDKAAKPSEIRDLASGRVIRAG